MGTKNLHEILSDRESISSSMQVASLSYLVMVMVMVIALMKRLQWRNVQKMLDEATEPWGIKVERVEM